MDSQAGTKHEAVQVPLDGARFQKVLDLLALGLYQHHFGERWVGSIRVHPDFIAFEGAESPADIDANRLILLECAKKLFVNEPKHGENPSVFWYRTRAEGPTPMFNEICVLWWLQRDRFHRRGLWLTHCCNGRRSRGAAEREVVGPHESL